MFENQDPASIKKAIALAAVSGMRCTLGPAILAAEKGDSSKGMMAAAALGEFVVDKIPFIPSRASLPLLLPRAVAGGYVARRILGHSEPWGAVLGAVVAAGVATLAPRVRRLIGSALGVPDAFVGLAEDYLALKIGANAVGMEPGELYHASGLGELLGMAASHGEGHVPQADDAFHRPPVGASSTPIGY